MIWLNQGISTVGVQQTDTDPEFRSVQSGELEDVLAATPAIVKQALARWQYEPLRKPSQAAANDAANTPKSPSKPAQSETPRLL